MKRKPRIVKTVPLELRPPNGAVAVPLGHGAVAWIDEEDWDRARPYAWVRKVTDGILYAQGFLGNASVYMHRLVMEPGPGVQVDHRTHDARLRVADNRRSNLRLATPSENSGNRRPQKRATASIFKGVLRDERRRCWVAEIRKDRVRHCLGSFKQEADAALRYDLAAVRLYGDRALTNFPVPGSASWIYGSDTAACEVEYLVLVD